MSDTWTEPRDKAEADKLIEGQQCPVCYSTLLVPLYRHQFVQWGVHCNHCGMELPVHVLLHIEEWRQKP